MTAKKIIAGFLIIESVFFSSPAVLLADEDEIAITDSPALDAVQVQPDQAMVDTTTVAEPQNESSAEQTSQTDIINQNYAQILNDANLLAETGKNTANYNTGSGIITTNDAKGTGELINIINTNSTEVPPRQDIFIEGGNTNINNELTVRNINYANVLNQLKAEINSGKNEANYNTGHGMIATGNASLGLNFMSIANTNLVGTNNFYADWQNIYNNYSTDIDLIAESSAEASSLSRAMLNSNAVITDVNDQTSIQNINTGKLNNQIDANITSGENKANYNTGTGSIATGKVNSSANVINFLNSNITSGQWTLKTLNIFGSWSGNLKMPAMSSPNLTAVELTSVANNNTAVINNNVNIKTISGENDASYNGGSGLVKIGGAAAKTNEMNVANTNITGDSWWLVVINKFGTWNGRTVDAPEAVAIKSNDVSTVLAPLNSAVDTVNTSETNFSHSNDIVNDNQAEINNTININAVSGGNEAKMNTGHGYIETGDIKGVNNIINFANTNITVGNWMVVVVNVFGDWEGDVVFNTPGGGTDIPTGDPTACPVITPQSPSETISANAINGTSDNISNNNNTIVENYADSSANTGQNSADYNTGNGEIETDWAESFVGMVNQVNSNSISVEELASDFNKNPVAPGTDAQVPNDTTTSCPGVTIEISPASFSMLAGEQKTFTAIAKNSSGDPLAVQPVFEWTATGGTIDSGGLYTAGAEAGSFGVTAKAPYGNQKTITINIATPSNGDGGGGSGGGSGGGPVSYGGGGGIILAKRLKGDFNNDGKINDLDFSILMASWNKERTGFFAEDSGQGMVNDIDFSIIMSNWTKTFLAKII